MKEATLSVNVGAGDGFVKPIAITKNNGNRMIPLNWYADEMDEFHKERKKRLEKLVKNYQWGNLG